MPSFNIETFRQALSYDGARPNLFQVLANFPTNVVGGVTVLQKASFLIKAASLPGNTLGVATQPYYGREVKFAGNRTFDPWTITVINDADFAIKNSFESWMNLMNSNAGNVRDTSMLNTIAYSCDWTVNQLNLDQSIAKTYIFRDAFPTDISPIDLDWGNNDIIEEFSVTIQYQYWEASVASALSPVTTS